MTSIDFRLPRRTRGLLAWSAWDLLAIAAGLGHLAFIVWIVIGFDQRPWWGDLLCGALYALAISWNINGLSHNFVHTPYFRSKALNRVFSLVESMAIGFSQTFYVWVHLRHHEGNNDRQDASGRTRDWLSIYRHGKNGLPENVWSYVFLDFFRSGESVHQALKSRGRMVEARWGRIELAAAAAFALGMTLINWRAGLFLLPFYYLGRCLSRLNGYYEHLDGDPDTPIAWGVSSYGLFYNLTWFNNGHHAEHHYRPAVHWTRLPALRRVLAAEQKAKGTHVMGPPHALGFLARRRQWPDPSRQSAP